MRRRRKQRGLAAVELARRARLSKATLSGLGSGRGNLTIDTLDAVAQALAVPLVDILTAPSRLPRCTLWDVPGEGTRPGADQG